MNIRQIRNEVYKNFSTEKGKFLQVFEAKNWDEVRSWGKGFEQPKFLWSKKQIEDYLKEVGQAIDIQAAFIHYTEKDIELTDILYSPQPIQALYDNNFRPIANTQKQATQLNEKYGFV